MSLNNQYILPGNVQLIPIAEIPEQAKAKFGYNDDDIVLTHLNARNTSKIITAASAALLKEFKKPASFIEGIFKYSYVNQLDPQQTLGDVYPFLSQLRKEGFLVLQDMEKKEAGTATTLLPGAKFKDYEVLGKIQGVADTEVYKLKKGDSFFALKLLKTNDRQSSLNKQFDNEVKILQHIAGSKIAPSLIESGNIIGDHYFVMEYFPGLSCDAATDKYRNLYQQDNLLQVLAISINILAAYETLHHLSVVHSDIHPGNILVAEDNTVAIIDFGLSQLANNEDHQMRGGQGFFYDPEYAEAVSKGQRPPAATGPGEQYALAALLYFLFTGKHYLNFSYERELLLQQIINDPPLPFIRHDIDVDPAIEQVIVKALSKHANDRYASVGDFKHALLQIQARITKPENPEINYSFNAFCDTIKSRLGYEGPFIEDGLHLSPTASVNYGAAGIAYLFYRMAIMEGDPGLLTLADVWINRAYDYLKDPGPAFYSTDIEINKSTVGSISFYHTTGGVHLVQALISKALGDHYTHQRSILNFIKAVSGKCDNLDLTLGKSSILIGCRLLYETLNTEQQELQLELKEFGNQVLDDIWQTIDLYSPVSMESPIIYNGIAHGWAGVLYATLQWCRQSETTLPAKFFERVEELLQAGIAEHDHIRWTLTNDKAVSWPGWCHGSAGYTFLWSELYKLTRQDIYLDTAKKAVNHFLREENFSTASLCCGVAGECYALLNLYNTTDGNFYLDEAKRLAKKLLATAYSKDARNNSLYKGDIGIAVLFSELNQPQYARMPLFE